MAATFTDQNLATEIASGITLVDFWAPWCGPCQMMGPVIEELATDFEGRAKVGKLDIDENGESAAKFGVQSIPTIKIFKDGEEIENFVGVQPKENLAAALEKHLA